MDRQYGDEIILRFPVNLEVKKTISNFQMTFNYNILHKQKNKTSNHIFGNILFFQKICTRIQENTYVF